MVWPGWRRTTIVVLPPSSFTRVFLFLKVTSAVPFVPLTFTLLPSPFVTLALSCAFALPFSWVWFFAVFALAPLLFDLFIELLRWTLPDFVFDVTVSSENFTFDDVAADDDADADFAVDLVFDEA